jgi:hypothetical protein
MFDYNHPNLKELLAYPTLTVFISLAITGNVPAGEWRELAKFGYAAICINAAIVPSIFLVKQFQEYIQGTDDNPRQNEPAKKYLDMNKADERGNVFAQSTGGIKIDNVRLFNKTLLDQRNGNLDVNMTEAFWIVEKVGDENRWQKIGGVGRSDFIDMLERGIKFGAYKKIGGQGKRVPDDWRKIRQLEQGHPLPQ